MSESNTPAPVPAAAPAAAAPSNSNLVLVIGILAICGSILYVGKNLQEQPSGEPTVNEMTLGDDFWMQLPTEVAALRDQLTTESAKLAELRGSIADKLEKVETLEDGPELEKLENEIEAVIGDQQTKVRHLQRDFVRRINGLRSTYIAKKLNK
jgi:hypothetical protein